MPNRFEKYLDLGDILHFGDPNQHFGERLTENLDQILHAIDCKGDAKAGWPPRAISSTIQIPLVADLKIEFRIFLGKSVHKGVVN